MRTLWSPHQEYFLSTYFVPQTVDYSEASAPSFLSKKNPQIRLSKLISLSISIFLTSQGIHVGSVAGGDGACARRGALSDLLRLIKILAVLPPPPALLLPLPTLFLHPDMDSTQTLLPIGITCKIFKNY